VSFRCGSVDAAALGRIKRAHGDIDCLFLDGAEDEDETVDQFAASRPFLSGAAVVAAHDWNTLKMRRFRRLIAGEPEWAQLIEIGPPESVGLAIFARDSRSQRNRHS
jgi:hypothetical protein